MKRVIKISIPVLLFFVQIVLAQDPQFSQFYSSPLYLSPALAGATEGTRLSANYRDQWPNLKGEFVTYAFSFDHYLERYKSGVGVLVLRDSEGGGLNTYTSLGLIYAYNIKVNRSLFIRPGFQFSSYYRNIDFYGMEFADQINRNSTTSVETPRDENVQHYDLSGSVLAYSKRYWFGVTSDHILSLSDIIAEDDTYTPFKFSAFGGAKIPLKQDNLLKLEKSLFVAFFYKRQSQFQQLDLGTYYENAPIRIGLWFRGIPVFKEAAGLNAVILMVGYTIKDLAINYSYDIATSRLLTSTGGAHEVSIAYLFDLNKTISQRRKMTSVPCPKF